MNILYKHYNHTFKVDFEIGMALYNAGHVPLFEDVSIIDIDLVKKCELVLFRHMKMRHKAFLNYKNYLNNYWFIKGSYLNGYYERDKNGYSGWSGINDFDLDSLIEKLPLDEVKINAKKWEKYIHSNASKYKQAEIGKDEKASKTWKFTDNSDFVFFAGQIFKDSVIRCSNFGDYRNTIKTAFKAFSDAGIKVVYKPHPIGIQKDAKEDKEFLNELLSLKYPNIYISMDDHSVHELIDKSVATVTINSGVGFEAILHKKPVFVLGKSDYTFIAHECKTAEDIRAIPTLMYDTVNVDKYDKFLCLYDKLKLVPHSDKKMIVDKLLQKEWAV